MNQGFLPNGSIIPYNTIGIGEDSIQALVCHTDNIGCCKMNSEGNWYLSDGSIVTSDSKEFGITRNGGQIRLYRTTETISLATTLCCIVPDINDTNQTVCVDSG